MSSYNPMSNQRRSAAHQEPERSTYLAQPGFNQSYGFQRDRYRVAPEYRNRHVYPTARREAVEYAPTLQGQYNQAYPRTSPVRPLDPRYGPHMTRHDFESQHRHSDYGDDIETSSTTAVVGSQVPQQFSAPMQPRRNPYAAAQTDDPYFQPGHSQPQHDSLTDYDVPNVWTTAPDPTQHNGSSYQFGGLVQHPMNPNAFFTPNPGPMPMHMPMPMPTPYTRPQARFDPAQTMPIPPPTMYAPAPASLLMNYSGIPVQPQGANVAHAAEYQSYIQPPANSPPPVNNNENIGGPRSILPEATKSPRKHRRGRGKRRGEM